MELYEFDFIEDDGIISYYFKTSSQIFYRIEFKPTGYIFGDEFIWSNYCYEFSIKLSESSPKNPPFDSLVSKTIASIFNHFFQIKEKIIVYTCDTSDRKHLARQHKFDRWFELFNEEKFLKFNASIEDKTLNTTYFNSLIISRDNLFKEEIISAFNNIMDNLEEDK